MIQNRVLALDDFTAYYDALHQEDHCNHDEHVRNEEELEKRWKENNKGPEGDKLCQLPNYMLQDNAESLWTQTSEEKSEYASRKKEALAEGERYATSYLADVQHVFSHCHHHWHPKDNKGDRRPIRGCRSKKGPNQCKQNFPLTRRLGLIPKVVCRGNCRKHGLRVSGRRNALGSIIGKRRSEWFSGTMRSLAAGIRDNTHTAPNWRVPLLRETHDADCKKKCWKETSLQKLIAIAQRAQRNTTGYFSGYISKRQPVGKFELRQATLNLQYLVRAIESKSNKEQYHRVANRVLGDLEFRGHARPSTEEFNLSARSHTHDVTAAEFIRTYRTETFRGNLLLDREKHERGKTSNFSTRSLLARVSKKQPRSRSKDEVKLSFEEAYGYRGRNPALYYLSPWEFTMWWKAERILRPDIYVKLKMRPLSKWTDAGHKWFSQTGEKEAALPLVHYVVIEPKPGDDSYVTFPDNKPAKFLRHNFVLLRNLRPMVPQPDGTPMPSPKLEAEQRCRILSVYLRPCVLWNDDWSPHVPHLADLDIRVCDRLRPKYRLRSKTKTEFKRCYETAWSNYQKNHVVSQHAARMIKNFLSTQMAETVEADVDEDGAVEREQWASMDVSWMSKECVDEILREGVAMAENDKGSTKAARFRGQLMDAIRRNSEMWARDPGTAEISASRSDQAPVPNKVLPQKKLDRMPEISEEQEEKTGDEKKAQKRRRARELGMRPVHCDMEDLPKKVLMSGYKICAAPIPKMPARSCHLKNKFVP